MRRRFLTLLAFVAGACLFALAPAAQANIQTTCPGNICSNSASIGGHNVSWYWTQNQNTANSSIKVRFLTPAFVAGGGTVRFKIYTTKAFSSYASLKNPDPTTTMPGTQSVDISNLWIERSVINPVAGTLFDFTQELRYDSLPTGQVDLTIEIAQYGTVSTFTMVGVPLQHIEFDPTAPTNRNEGDAFPAPPYASGYLNCYDSVDNDLDYVKDCADSNCLGKTIQSSPLRVCEAPETTCNDGLDNDGNGKADCADPNCNGKAGNPAGDKFCGAENGGVNHANCADGFDNDGNGKTDCTDDTAATGCWKTGFQDCAATEISCTDNIDNDRDQNYSETIDTNAVTGIDCQDYDCKGSVAGHCPLSERLLWNSGSGTFVDTPSQCFDGVDNDLDGAKDCADTDCLGATWAGHSCASYEAWLPPSPLGTGAATSTPASYFNFCNDGIDNDGNGLTDGADPSCKNRFGECSPFGGVGFAATEDISFLSCADNLDNDLNGTKDCADAACRAGNKLGRGGCTSSACGGSTVYTQTDAAACSASENTAAMCGDGIDNNNNGTIDCADAACSGVRHGPAVLPGFTCGAESGAANCSDGYDNDGNGNIDCLDAACQTGVTCALRNWSLAASCVPVPDTTALANIVAGGSVQYAHDDRLHISDQYHVRFKGTGVYSSLTIVVGDAVIPANAFPFNAMTCVLSGTGAASMTYTSSDARVGALALKSGSTFAAGFDVTLTCTGSAVILGPQSYTIDYVANHGGTIEYGEATMSVQVFENVVPVLSPTSPAPTPGPAVDVEGIIAGKVSIPVGGTVRFQAKPGDPAPSSGICSCAFSLNGTYQVSPDGNCTVSKSFVNDVPAFQVTTSALDGGWNRSATTTAQSININVTPSVSQNMTIASSASTYRGGSTMTFSAAFQTDTLSTFPGPCHLFVYNDSWAGAEAGTVAWTPSGIGTPILTCAGTYTVPAALAAGRYFLVVEATDSSGDLVRSNIQTMLKCENADVGTGQCKDADFDNDGVPEGRTTPNAYASPPAPQYKAAGQQSSCDNCINLANANQLDSNGNGVGDACEASAVGRCQYKYCGSGPTDPTPGGHCSVDSDCTAGDTCVIVAQSMCTINCAADPDCSPPTAPIAGGTCVLDWGICTGPAPDQGNCCFVNSDCTSGNCDNLVKPFLQTLKGQVYATGGIVQGQSTPPISNATYCVESAGAITNFSSQAGCSLQNLTSVTPPTSANNYGGTFGAVDVTGALNGKYGPVTAGGAIANPLNGQIVLYDTGAATGLTVSTPIAFANGTAGNRGNGLIIVKGDLVINADVTYQNTNVADLKQLASVGWLVLKGSACVGGTGPGCGNVTIAGNVQNFAGAIFAEGVVSTGTSGTQLNANGAWVAKNYQFQRNFSSRTGGAEKVTFDPRIVMNPPPGMTDVARSLPGFSAVPAQ